jgi:hypothetical protein
MASRMMSGEGFSLEDFIEQLGMLRKLGPIQNLLGMMPGAARNKELLSQVNDKDLDRAEAIVRSMTPEERRNPKIINGSRRLRIANGSGVAVGEVSQLVSNFFEGQKQMRAMFAGGMPGMPGLMGAGGARRAAKAAPKAKKGKRKSGDPRKATLAASGGGQGGAQPGRGPGNSGRGDNAQDAQAAAAAPASMEELAEMLRDAQAAEAVGGPGGFNDAFTGFRGGPSSLPPLPGGQGGQGNIPAAFGKRRKKK